MSLRKKDIVVDLEKHSSTVFKYKQGDNGCDLNIALIEDGEEVDLTGYGVEAYFEVPSKSIYKRACTTVGNVATVVIVEELTREVGNVAMELVLTDGDVLLTTFTIYFKVEKSIAKNNVTQLAIFTLNELAEMVEDENSEIDGNVEVRLIKDISINK